MDLELEGKAALVTGGNGAIGSAIARALAAEGCDIAILGRDEQRLEAVAGELAGESAGNVVWVRADTTSRGEVDAAVADAASRLGRLDILVNNAGFPGGRAAGPLEQVSDDELLLDLDTKYAGYIRCARAAVPHMKERGWGRLIHIGGLAARQSGSYSGGGRNIAIAHLSKTLSDELGRFGITSNVVHPGPTRTAFVAERLAREAAEHGTTAEEAERRFAEPVAIGRIVEPAEVAHVVAFLASPKSAAITGETIGAGGGWFRGVTT